jgi:hypothetical protein
MVHFAFYILHFEFASVVLKISVALRGLKCSTSTCQNKHRRTPRLREPQRFSLHSLNIHLVIYQFSVALWAKKQHYKHLYIRKAFRIFFHFTFCICT